MLLLHGRISKKTMLGLKKKKRHFTQRFMYVKCSEKANMKMQKVNLWFPGAGNKDRLTVSGHQGSNWGERNLLKLVCSDGCKTLT